MEEFFPEIQKLKTIEELPDPFLRADGTRVTSPSEWAQHREYLKALLAHYMYGTMPEAPGNTTGEVIFSRMCYAGKAVTETIRITFGPGLSFMADLIRPVKEGKVPVITMNQFKGCHGCPAEEEIVLRRGYAVMEFEKEQLASDDASGLEGPLAKAYAGYTWGTIAMWAWMQSRMIDYLATTDYADMEKIIATGHSRGGKAALCCGIYDERVAITAANGSGCGGTGCFRFLGGRMGEGLGECETAASIAKRFPYWWTDEFVRMSLSGSAEIFPFDLHEARLLVAPRAVISTDALSDIWANPFGTQIAWRASQEVFDFLGVPQKNAMHMRDGGHDYQPLDWYAVADFADRLFYGKEKANNIVYAPDAHASASDWRRIRLHYSWRNPLA